MTTHSGPIVATKGSLTAIQCSRCGFIHLDPIPTELPYASGRYHRVVKPDYRKEYDEDAEWWNAVYGDWLELTAKNVPDDGTGQWMDLLDVGSGTGHFVRRAREDHWMALGLESDKKMVEQSFPREHFLNMDYQSYSVVGGWSVVSAHFVMEHLPDPVHFLQWARERLAKDGLLLVTIPNDFSVLQQKVMDESLLSVPSYYWLDENHISYWNLGSFSDFLERNGYFVLDVYGSWEPEIHLLEGRNYLKDTVLGRWLHRNRMLDDLKMTRGERMKKYLDMGKSGRGRDLTFLCRKEE